MAIINTGARDVYRTITNEVKLGSVEVMLNKPFNYVLYKVAETFGNSIPKFLAVCFFGIPIFVWSFGIPNIDFSMLWFFGVLGVFVLGQILCVLMYTCVGLTSFWLVESLPVYWVVDKLGMVFGGAWVPVALFPGIFRSISENSPMGAIYLPAQMFNVDFMDNMFRFLVLQSGWSVIFFVVVYVLFNKALSRVSINGG